MNAEERFLPQLVKLHKRFPALRIVLEHATTRAAVEVVKSLGDTVACTITAHHLALTVDDWAGQSFHFCKPVAKFPDDRKALQDVIRQGKPHGCLKKRNNSHTSQDTLVSSWVPTLHLTPLRPNYKAPLIMAVRLGCTRPLYCFL